MRVLVLKELNNANLSGYDLIKELTAVLGKAPSPGTIYPLLKELQSKDIVTVKKEGRRKIYSITTKGKQLMESILKEKEEIMLKHIELIRLFGNLTNQKEIKHMLKIVEQMKSGGELLLKNIDVWTQLRSIAIKLALSKDYEKKETKVRAIIQDAANQLKKIYKER